MLRVECRVRPAQDHSAGTAEPCRLGVQRARSKSPDTPVVDLQLPRSGRERPIPPRLHPLRRPASTRGWAVVVSSQDLASPGNGVLDTTAVRLWLDPQFEVPGSIIRAHTVPMMDVFAGEEIAPQDGLHHEDVFENVFVVSCASRVSGRLDVEITPWMPRSRCVVALPAWTGWPTRWRRTAAHTR